MSSNLDKTRDYIASMPSLPTSVGKVMEICNNPKTSPTDLNHVISLDPVLMGKVLKLINSAYYGLGQQITSLVRAIIMLGINTVKNLALSTAVLDKFGKSGEFRALNMEGFWRHSLATAVSARLIAKKRNVDSQRVEEFFAAGLLHDIGKIPLNNVLAQEYVTTMGVSDREKISLVAAEARQLETDHNQIGALIAAQWKLDRSIADVIAFHHAPDTYTGPHRELLDTVVIANYFANREELGFSGDRYPLKPSPETYQRLCLSRDILEDLADVVAAEVEKAKIFLKLT